MGWNKRLQCVLLLALVAVPLSIPSLHATSFGGWPALGFAVALFLVAGPQYRWYVAAAEFVVIAPALAFSYDVIVPLGAVGSLSVIVPAMLTAYLLTPHHGDGLLLDEVDNTRY